MQTGGKKEQERGRIRPEKKNKEKKREENKHREQGLIFSTVKVISGTKRREKSERQAKQGERKRAGK